MIENVIQKWVSTDKEFEEAKKLQKEYDERDPKHEHLPYVRVIDCRTQY